MEVLKKLETDFTQALKDKNDLVVLVLRQLKSVVSNAEIAKKREELSEEQKDNMLAFDYYQSNVVNGEQKILEWKKYLSGRETKKTITKKIK